MRVFWMLLLTGCGELAGGGVDAGADCNLSPNGFDTSCTTASDCQLVWFGDVCDPVCAECVPNAAINMSAVPAYQAAFSALLGDGGRGGCFCPRTSVVADCNQGACVTVPRGDE